MTDEIYMKRCIQLARQGQCNVSPNPMVGAVIVCDNKIIGEGYHIRSGSPHAEVNAINSVQNPDLLPHSTLYVSLEPCSHHGKTPPCADLLIEKQIPRIVIGCQDPFPQVSGRGIGKLLDAGREVRVGVLEDKCLRLNKTFFTFHALHRPYITLKWAESADGYIDLSRTDGSPAQLSTELTQMLVHKRRAETSAIMVGTQTAKLDNPSLTVRYWSSSGQDPIRIVIDRHLTLDKSLNLFDGNMRTLLFTSRAPALPAPPDTVECIPLDYTRDILPQITNTLYEKNIPSLLVEGGARLMQSFIDAGLWDEAFVEKSTLQLGSGVQAPVFDSLFSYTLQPGFGEAIRHYVHPR